MSLSVNGLNHLAFAGHDVALLAEQYGTPLYIYDEKMLRANARSYQETLDRVYPSAQTFYAAKAFLTTAMAALIGQEGLGLDVVSGGELATAFYAGFDPARIIFNGNNKSREEIAMALRHGVSMFVIDNLDEVALLDATAASLGRRPSVLVRVNPGVEAHTHEYVQTAVTDCKFGLGAWDGAALEAVRRVLSSQRLVLAGYHCHIGSQIFDLSAYEAAVQAMAVFSARVQQETGFWPGTIDMGGGLGIQYTGSDSHMDIEGAVRSVARCVQNAFARPENPLPRLFLEPGRSIAGEAGLAVYRVGSVKKIPGARTYVAVDGGMADNPRVALYGSRYEAIVVNRVHAPGKETVTLAGKCCESGDLLARDIELGGVRPGDLVAMPSAGAYQYSMAGNYNRLPRPAVLFAHPGGVDVVARRETYADVLKLDIMPARLRKGGLSGDKPAAMFGD